MAKTFADQLASRLNDALSKTEFAGELPEGFTGQIDQAQNRQFGDYQSNAAMILAKQLRRNPREVAAAIIEQFDGGTLSEKPEIAGPGFINFRITKESLESVLQSLLNDPDQLGLEKAAEPKTIVADFAGPDAIDSEMTESAPHLAPARQQYAVNVIDHGYRADRAPGLEVLLIAICQAQLAFLAYRVAQHGH